MQDKCKSSTTTVPFRVRSPTASTNSPAAMGSKERKIIKTARSSSICWGWPGHRPQRPHRVDTTRQQCPRTDPASVCSNGVYAFSCVMQSEAVGNAAHALGSSLGDFACVRSSILFSPHTGVAIICSICTQMIGIKLFVCSCTFFPLPRMRKVQEFI